MADAVNLGVAAALAIYCAWDLLCLDGKRTSILVLPMAATAMLCGTVVAGSLGLLEPRPAAGQVWVNGHWRTLPDGDLTNNLGYKP